ncbi:hypothetical protein NDU88_003621 [Pleurodeles waltl]|uniref:Androgen receptor n=1 Tax=Pleurodeles waltl TaxID=8319 RepID=A0AAV7RGF1_PLEWA|nr:hypothetical protein NDU88_003621 [Pleurodeles waltl]
MNEQEEGTREADCSPTSRVGAQETPRLTEAVNWLSAVLGGRAVPRQREPDPWARPRGDAATQGGAAGTAGAVCLDRNDTEAPPLASDYDLRGGGGAPSPWQRGKRGGRAGGCPLDKQDPALRSGGGVAGGGALGLRGSAGPTPVPALSLADLLETCIS